MLKTILNVKGAQQLSKNEQKSITGGKRYCDPNLPCPVGQICVGSPSGGLCYLA